MAKDDRKTSDVAPKKAPAAESKAEAAPKIEGVKAEAANTDGVKTEAAKTDAAPSRQGMGEGQKPVSQAYKDNWNMIFGKKEKKKKR